MELVDTTAVNLRILSCTLEQLADNVKVITKETFKLLNLREVKPG